MNDIVLDIQDLSVTIDGKSILNNIQLSIPHGESYVMFGPNGSGKSTLIKAIIGIPPYKIISGKIIFNGQDITHLPIDQRIKLGISTSYQHPPEIKGIKLVDIFKFCLKKKPNEELSEKNYALIEKFKLTSFLNRDINVGFSGGERKRSEVLQMIFLKPKLLLLDEPDSGVDIESLRLIAKEIQNYITETGSSVLIVTHQGEILNYITTKRACVLLDSRIHCYRNSQQIFNTIKDVGFAKCIECQEGDAEEPEKEAEAHE
jgi:Fe-S cluster assembly ATP-binding protein